MSDLTVQVAKANYNKVVEQYKQKYSKILNKKSYAFALKYFNLEFTGLYWIYCDAENDYNGNISHENELKHYDEDYLFSRLCPFEYETNDFKELLSYCK